MRPLSRLIIVAAAVIALAGCGAKSAPGEPAGTSATGGRTMGKADAPVKLVEYASLACHHCADFNNDEFGKLKTQYIDTGKVLYEMRAMPHASADMSAAGFMLAACSGDDRYFQTVDGIFKALPDIIAGRVEQRAAMIKVAASVGMNEAAFEKCVSDEKGLLAVNALFEANSLKSPGGTPAFFINDVEYKGPNTAADLGKAIDAASGK